MNINNSWDLPIDFSIPTAVQLSSWTRHAPMTVRITPMFSRVLDQTTKSSRQTSRPSPTVARLKSRRGRAMLEVRDVPAAYYCNPVWSPVSMATTINVGAEFAITGSTAI